MICILVCLLTIVYLLPVPVNIVLAVMAARKRYYIIALSLIALICIVYMLRNNTSRSTDSNSNKNSFILFDTDYNEFEDAKVPLQKLINISNFAYINQAADCNAQDEPLLGKNFFSQ